MYEKSFINYIKKEYKKLEKKKNNIANNPNIQRYTSYPMSYIVENAVAILINEIKKGKINCIIDPQLSVDKTIYRPDIIIYDKNNVIKYIIEVKSHLGYLNKDFSKKYQEKINKIKKAKQISLKKTEFTIHNQLKHCLVILMKANSHQNEENLNIPYFILFEKNKWYNDLNINFINKNKHGFDDFIKFLNTSSH